MTGLEADVLAGRISIHLRRNQFVLCHELLRTAKRELRERRQARNGYDKLPLAEVCSDVRMVNMLEKAGYMYVEDLVGKNAKDIGASIPYFGAKMTRELKEMLEGLPSKRRFKHVLKRVQCPAT